jgi:hypothetical protein
MLGSLTRAVARHVARASSARGWAATSALPAVPQLPLVSTPAAGAGAGAGATAWSPRRPFATAAKAKKAGAASAAADDDSDKDEDEDGDEGGGGDGGGGGGEPVTWSPADASTPGGLLTNLQFKHRGSMMPRRALGQVLALCDNESHIKIAIATLGRFQQLKMCVGGK